MQLRVGLLDLVEEHHGFGVLGDGVRELAAVVVAHVARGRADELRVLVGEGELGAVHAHEAARAVAAEEMPRERAGELGLARARPSAEQERRQRALALAQASRGRAHRASDRLHRAVLADDLLEEGAAESAGAAGEAVQGAAPRQHGRRRVGRRRALLLLRVHREAHLVDVEVRIDLDAELVEEVLHHERIVGEEGLERLVEVLLEVRHAGLDDQLAIARSPQARALSQAEPHVVQGHDLHEAVRQIEVAIDAALGCGAGHGRGGERQGVGIGAPRGPLSVPGAAMAYPSSPRRPDLEGGCRQAGRIPSGDSPACSRSRLPALRKPCLPRARGPYTRPPTQT